MTGMTRGKDASKEFDRIVGAYSKKYAEYVLGNGLSPRDPESTIGFLTGTKDGKVFQKELTSAGINIGASIKEIFERFVKELNETKIRDVLRETVAEDPGAEAYADGKRLLSPGKTRRGYSVGIIPRDKGDEER